MSQLALAPGSRRRNSYGRLSGEQWGHVPGLFWACLGPSTWVVAAGPVCLFQTPALPLFPISALASRASWACKRGPASQAPFPTSGCQGPEGPIVAAPYQALPPTPFHLGLWHLLEGIWQEASSGCPCCCTPALREHEESDFPGASAGAPFLMFVTFCPTPCLRWGP